MRLSVLSEYPATIRSQSSEKVGYHLRRFETRSIFQDMRLFSIVSYVVTYGLSHKTLKTLVERVSYSIRFEEDIKLMSKAKSIKGLKQASMTRGISLRSIERGVCHCQKG